VISFQLRIRCVESFVACDLGDFIAFFLGLYEVVTGIIHLWTSIECQLITLNGNLKRHISLFMRLRDSWA